MRGRGHNSGIGRLSHILRTMMMTGLAYVVNYGITLLLTPYITNRIGTEAYGFVTMAKQFAQYATIITTALNVYAARYIGISFHKGDSKEASMYYSSVFWGDMILATFIFMVAFGAILVLEYLLSIPDALVSDVKLLFLFTYLAFWITTVCSVFGCAGYVQDRMDLKGLFKTLSYLTVWFLSFVMFCFLRESYMWESALLQLLWWLQGVIIG